MRPRQLPNEPFPGIVRPGPKPWVCVANENASAAQTNLKTREMIAPSGSDHLSRIIRTHEMAHARFTKPMTAKFAASIHAEPFLIQIAEDYLITHKLQIKDLPRPCDCSICETEMDRIRDDLVRRGLDIDAAQAIVNIKAGGLEYGESTSLTQTVIEQCYSLRQNTRSIPRRRKSIAEYLQTLITGPDQRPSGGPRTPTSQGTGVRWLNPGPPVVQPMPDSRARRTRVTRATDTGAVLRFVHRAALDGQVFGRTVRQDSATVLVDASGSMSFDSADLNRIIERFPAGTVAMYSGEKFFVVAHGGRRVHDVPGLGGSNKSDGPCLDWLCNQPGRKYWLTDLQVTDRYDNFSDQGQRDCIASAAAAGVRILPDVDSMIGGRS
jgi:hypothetical protein